MHNFKNHQKIPCKREGKQTFFCKQTQPAILKSPIVQSNTIDVLLVCHCPNPLIDFTKGIYKLFRRFYERGSGVYPNFTRRPNFEIYPSAINLLGSRGLLRSHSILSCYSFSLTFLELSTSFFPFFLPFSVSISVHFYI